MLSKMNVRPTKTIEFSSVGAIKECAAIGMGIALLPAVLVVDHLARKRPQNSSLGRPTYGHLDLHPLAQRQVDFAGNGNVYSGAARNFV